MDDDGRETARRYCCRVCAGTGLCGCVRTKGEACPECDGDGCCYNCDGLGRVPEWQDRADAGRPAP